MVNREIIDIPANVIADHMNASPDTMLTTEARQFRPGSSVLDIGAGTGRNSLYLASQGFRVTALDNDSGKLLELQEKCDEQQLETTVLNADINSWQPTQQYDNVISFYALRFLSAKQFDDALARLRQATAPGGVHILRDFIREPGINRPAEYWPPPDALAQMYEEEGWQVIHDELAWVNSTSPDSAGASTRRLQQTLIVRR